MKKIATICSLLLICSSAVAQYYLRGEVKDEKNNPLLNAKIYLHSTKYIYYSGSSGAFGITTSKPADSITVSLEGYQTATFKIEASRYASLILKILHTTGGIQKNRLLSFTKDLKFDETNKWTHGGETYSSLIENDFVPAKKFSETRFAISTDKASYSNIRRFLNMNSTVPPDAIRTEELLNYFNFGYTEPPKDSLFDFHSYISECPWNTANQLLFLQLSAKKIDPEKIPPSNLVFLIDVSGSMDMPNRLPLLKAGFILLVHNLREKDTVSIVVYGSSVGVWLPPTSGKEKLKIQKAIEDLSPGGATAGESGIRTAYRLAKSQFIKNGNNRVILATDGDFNVGQSSESELEKMITQHQQSGIYLTCLGVGMGNYKDSKLEVLAKKGNGNFAYIDNEKEIEKVLVKEFTQTMFSIADDVALSVRFNPQLVREYRLIGFDNKYKALTDSLSELEGGEVGSGHAAMALFELSPISIYADNVFYSQEGVARITVNYKNPGDSVKRMTAYTCPYTETSFNELPDCYRFAASIVMFASLLKNSKHTRQLSWNDVIIMAHQAHNPKDAVQKEFIAILEKAKKIYGRQKKKKRDDE